MFRTADFKSPLARLSYAGSLFMARSQEEGGKKKFGCTLIFPLAARAELEKLVGECIVGEWGDKGIVRTKAGLIRLPFLAGDGKEARSQKTGGLHPGMGPTVFFIRTQAGEDRPPAVWFTNPNVQEKENVVYSGCYGKGILNVFAWSNPKNGDGVSFGISGFQKLQDGERLGGSGGVDPAAYHETIADEGPAPAATKTGAGASGLFGS